VKWLTVDISVQQLQYTQNTLRVQTERGARRMLEGMLQISFSGSNPDYQDQPEQ